MKAKKIVCPIYKTVFYLICGEPTKSALKKYNIPEDFLEVMQYSHVFVSGLKDSKCMIFFNSKITITQGHIAHEGLHLTNHIMNEIGYKFDPNNDEPIAYLLMYVVDEIYKFISQHKIQIS